MPAKPLTMKQKLIRNVAKLAKMNRRYIEPSSRAQLDRLYNLRAHGPLSVTQIDLVLARDGWVDVYDDAPGNESVDFTHPRSMEAADKFENAEARFYGKKLRGR